MQQIEWGPRIATFGNTQPAIIVLGMQDQRETVMDGGDEFLGLRRDDCESLKAGAVRPLPRVSQMGMADPHKVGHSRSALRGTT